MLKKINTLLIGVVIGLTLVAPAVAGDKGVIVVPISKKPGSVFSSFLRDSRPFVDGRLRYGWADIEGKEDSYVLSLRNRFGIETGRLAGFSFLAEGEHTWVLTDPDQYNPFPGTGSKQSIIADPENIQLNRLQLAFDGYDSHFVAGRQKIALDDLRFIGNVAWRQNDQTYDALLLQNHSIKDLDLLYSYIDRANRVFGELTPRAALTRFESDSHLIHVQYSGLSIGTIRGFAYLLDLGDDSALAKKFSTDTYGIELQGAFDVHGPGLNFTYLFTAAYQQDAGSNPIDYSAGFYRGEFGLKKGGLNGGVGTEILTSEAGRAAFQFPFATAHKYSGFADAFVVTPDRGLREDYAWAGIADPLKIKHKLSLHYFTNDYGADALGFETDYLAVRKINEHFSVALQLAFLNGQGSQGDIKRATLQLDYLF